jgi:hypothetical protein
VREVIGLMGGRTGRGWWRHLAGASGYWLGLLGVAVFVGVAVGGGLLLRGFTENRHGPIHDCGEPTKPVDPGDRLLHELAAEPVFAALPNGATRIDRKDSPSSWSPGVEGGHWTTPLVLITFTSTLPLSALNTEFDAYVKPLGWRLDTRDPPPPDDTRWKKKLPDGTVAHLDLSPNFNAPNSYQYWFTGTAHVRCSI